MEMLKVGPEQRRLNELFTGTWTGEEKLSPSDWDLKGGTAFGTWTCHASLDGFTLFVDYAEERDGAISYRGHGIHGWDRACGKFLVYWFDNIGVMPQVPSKATLDGNRYTYQTDDGPLGSTRMTYEWTDNRFEFRIDKSKDHGATWNPMHVGHYTRTP